MALPLDAWLQAAAVALDARLRAGEGGRADRREGRRLLRRAFDARERDDVSLALVVEVDRAAHPLVARIPAGPRIGVRLLRTRPDPAWVERLLAVDDMAAAVAGRTERMLEGLRSEEVRRALWPVVLRSDHDQPEMPLTRG